MNNFNQEKIKLIIEKGKNELNNPEILSVIYSLGRDITNEEEYNYAIDILLFLYNNSTEKIKANIILAFSLIAINYQKLDREKIEKLIIKEYSIAKDENKEIISNAIDDINFALKWDIKEKKV